MFDLNCDICGHPEIPLASKRWYELKKEKDKK